MTVFIFKHNIYKQIYIEILKIKIHHIKTDFFSCINLFKYLNILND